MQTYQLLDAGDQQRLECWGDFRLIRPEPSAKWPKHALSEWQQADALYQGTSVQNGTWKQLRSIPEKWTVELDQWQFVVGLGGSKHLGLFPEQLDQWRILDALVTKNLSAFSEPIRFLNLFAYTGAASVVATMAGAFTTHVDSSSPAIGRAKENQKLNHLDERSIRWIKDDVVTFVQREIRRGHHYDVIALDPPAYGHGTQNERFSIYRQLPLLLKEVKKLLSDKALALFLTTYSEKWHEDDVHVLCQNHFNNVRVTTQSLSLRATISDVSLTTGAWALVELV